MTDPPSARPQRIAVLLHDLRGGGAERASLNLVKGLLDAGRDVDLVLVKAEGEYLDQIPPGVRLFDLNKVSVLAAIPAIRRYLRTTRPDAVLSAMTHVNVALLICSRLSGACSRITVVEHNQISIKAALARSLRGRAVYQAARWLYRFADHVVAVSDAQAEDVASFTGLSRDAVLCAPNAVFDETLIAQAAAEPVAHPWLNDPDTPVLVAAGRLHAQKGFDILLEAFRLINDVSPCRLIILGEGPERAALIALSHAYGITDRVDFTGFVRNPFAMMARASAFVLSSRWEGLPTVLIEAMACGAPVIATDCPSGPREILEDGRWGRLVPVANPRALARAIQQTLSEPRSSSQQRANAFTITASTRRYLNILDHV
ncbi:MAG: hypothetical protein JWR59_361 [Brevundimonas sp.]|nr:hypothetical protein [Brevundimonas sp.]